MAKALRVAMEIMDICNDNNYEIDYFKLQKLTCICQLVHYSIHQVPLSPEKMYYWTLGPSFKEVYSYFYKKNFIEKNKISNDMIDIINKEKNIIGDLLYFERDTINFVINKYVTKDLNVLVELCLNDSLYKKIKQGDIIELHKLKECFNGLCEQEKVLKYSL